MGGVLAAVVALLILFVTRSPGPGLDPDGMAYLGAAQSLVRSGTLRVPTGEWSNPDSTSALSFWPPGYPAAIAIPVVAGLAPVQGARFVNVVAAALTAATIFFIITAATSGPAGITAVLVTFVTAAVLDVHLSILSEPLFIACLTLTVAAMVYARDRLWLLGILAAATVMVRYAGACAPMAVVAWTLLDSRFAVGRRIQRAVVVALLPALAIIAWVVRTALATDRHGTPHIAIYGHWDFTLRQWGETLSQWLMPLVPGVVQYWLAAAFGMVLVLLLFATVRDTASSRLRQAPAARVATMLGVVSLMAFFYLAVICVSRLLVGGTIPFDWRIMAPLIVLLEIMTVVSVAHWWRAYHRPLQVCILLVALTWGAASAVLTSNDAIEAVTNGSDFAASQWRESPSLAWVRERGKGYALYSNWPSAIYFHAHRIARELPDSDEVRHELSDFAKVLRASNGIIVGFKERSPDVVAPDSLAKLLGLRTLARFPDGTVWGI
jgi:hypothetical protein